jgi:cleavage and polyadenylation specificity factor subunit 1
VAVSASFIDPYLVILRDDSSVLLLQADSSGDLDEVSLPQAISTSKWRSGCLYHDKSQSFSPADSTPDSTTQDERLLFLLGLDSKLSVSRFEEITWNCF